MTTWYKQQQHALLNSDIMNDHTTTQAVITNEHTPTRSDQTLRPQAHLNCDNTNDNSPTQTTSLQRNIDNKQQPQALRNSDNTNDHTTTQAVITQTITSPPTMTKRKDHKPIQVAMSDPNQDPTERFLQKTIKLKKRSLKPYEKKCVKKNEFRYDVPIQPSIPPGQPTVCYNRINTIQTDHQGQPTLNVRSELAEPARETLSSRQDVGNNYETSEAGPSEGNKNGTFLSPVELYVQSLKLDKGISIFPGVNGPGNVLVAKDFSVEKQKLQKDKWILIERKPVSFENDQFCWVHWCSCNAVTSRQVSLLDSYVNTSEEGVCYGFQVMQTNESPDVPFTIFRTRFKTAPKYIIYDNACKLHSYCISRDPQFFKDTEFYVDRLHWENHTSCSYGYNLSLYPQFNSVNSQLSEQSNAGLKRIKDQLSYMTANNFLSHCTFYLWNKNMGKLSIC
ncbi:hypothetical protein ScPMuIL_015000 [Solemya velum]